MAILSHFFVALKDIADYQTKDFGFGIWLINALDKHIVFKTGECTINKFRGLIFTKINIFFTKLWKISKLYGRI